MFVRNEFAIYYIFLLSRVYTHLYINGLYIDLYINLQD